LSCRKKNLQGAPFHWEYLKENSKFNILKSVFFFTNFHFHRNYNIKNNCNFKSYIINHLLILSRIYNIAFFLHILIISQNNSNNKSFVYSVSNCQNMWFPCGATMKIESIVEEETTHLHSQTYIYYSFLLTRGYNKLYKILLLLIAAEIILSSSSTIFGCLRCVKIKLEQYANVAADKWVYI